MIDPKEQSILTVEEEEFWNDPTLLQPVFVPERHTFNNGRFYKTENDVWVKSCTTMLKVLAKGVGYEMALGNMPSYAIAMGEWGQLADRGSKLHTLIAKTILKREVDVADLCEADFKKYITFLQFWTQHNEPIPITIECPMATKELPYAGTIDLIAKVSDKKGNIKTVLMDWKSGKEWASYPFQISAYKYLAEACLNITIDELWLIYLVEFRGEAIPTVTDPARYKKRSTDPIPIETIMEINNIYEILYKKPTPKMEIENPGVFGLDKYKELTNKEPQ